MSDFVKKTLQRAIDSRDRGGMQTGTPKVEIREAEAQRMIIEVQHLQQRIAELDAQVPKWVSVEDDLPEWGVLVLVFVPESDGEDAYVTMDCMDEDYEYWQLISENYDHAQAVGRVTDNDKMPSGVAPYTHWMPMPQPPKGESHEC